MVVLVWFYLCGNMLITISNAVGSSNMMPKNILIYVKSVSIWVKMCFFSIREGTIFYSTLSLPAVHEYSGIYLQPCTWDDYHIFLIVSFVFTRLLLDEIYHFIKLAFDWLMNLHQLSTFCYKQTNNQVC